MVDGGLKLDDITKKVIHAGQEHLAGNSSPQLVQWETKPYSKPSKSSLPSNVAVGLLFDPHHVSNKSLVSSNSLGERA